MNYRERVFSLEAAYGARKHTQKDLASILNVSPRTIRYWKSGKRTPSLQHKKKINSLWSYYKKDCYIQVTVCYSTDTNPKLYWSRTWAAFLDDLSVCIKVTIKDFYDEVEGNSEGGYEDIGNITINSVSWRMYTWGWDKSRWYDVRLF